MTAKIQSNNVSFVTDEMLKKLYNEKIIIDCGHTPLGILGRKIFLGRNGLPSETELLTLNLGVETYYRLKNIGKNPKLNICFSDTTRFLGTNQNRPFVKSKCVSGDIYDDLPIDYKQILSGLPKTDLIFTLQTINSNRFSRLIKYIKKDIRSLGSNELAYKKYNVLFATDLTDTYFCFSNEFLLNTEQEHAALGGDWWLDEFSTLHPSDIKKVPIAPLKKKGIISLYSKSTGILCPATYGGLILNTDENIDHVAIYSRNDDPNIGEKIMRGIISTCVLQKKFNKKNFLQIILNQSFDINFLENIEISLLSGSEVNVKNSNFDELIKIFHKRLSHRYKQFI